MQRQIILFYEKCRLCLQNEGVKNIFGNEDLSGDILLCTGVIISESDNLPQKICSFCLGVVNNAKKLRMLAEKNDSILKLLFEGESNEKKKPKTSGISVRKDLFEAQTVTSTSKTQEDTVSSVETPTTSTDTQTVNNSESSENENKCDICSKTFVTYKKLYMHKRFHNKTISCPLDGCEKMFATKGDLEKHCRTHTGEKPYRCNICGAKFTQNITLKSHRQNIHSS